MSLNADLSGTSVLLIQPLELEMGPLEPFLKSLSFTLEGDPCKVRTTWLVRLAE